MEKGRHCSSLLFSLVNSLTPTLEQVQSSQRTSVLLFSPILHDPTTPSQKFPKLPNLSDIHSHPKDFTFRLTRQHPLARHFPLLNAFFNSMWLNLSFPQIPHLIGPLFFYPICPTKRQPISVPVELRTTFLRTVLFLKNNFTEAHLAYHKIYPFQVYNSVTFLVHLPSCSISTWNHF